MSTLQVANLHFNATGSERLDFVDGDIKLFTSGNFRINNELSVNSSIVIPSFDQANTARTHANNAYNIANLAFDKANTGGSSVTKFTANIGNNSANSFNIAHNLNTFFIIPAVREYSSGYFVYPDMRNPSANHILLEFVNAPTTNQYSVILI